MKLVFAVLGVVSLACVPAASASGIEGTVKVSGAPTNADAVVYVQHVDGPVAPPTSPVTLDQRSMQFMPHVLPVVIGTTVRFLNNDPTQHYVFSPDYEKYNLGTWPQGQSKDHTFATCAKPPCAYVQLCRVHPEMEGYVVVLQNPHFAVTGADGHYKIDNLPPGTYTIAVWHPKLRAQPKPVVVDAAKPATVDFVLTK
jgi:plastocyanin